MNTTNRSYSATDFERYHAGTMSGKEMHALERAALEDPFLADALEGYAFTNTQEEDLALLRAQLSGKTERKKIFFLSPRANNGWLRIAAMLVIIAGVGTVFYRINYKEAAEGLAVNKPIPVIPPAQIPDSQTVVKIDPPAVNPTINNGLTTTASVPVIAKRIQPNNIKTAPQPVADDNIGYAETVQSKYYRRSDSSNVNTVPPPVLAEVTRKEQIADVFKKVPEPVALQSVKKSIKTDKDGIADYKMEGRVTDDKGAPIQGAAVQVNGSTLAITDRTGNFSVQTNEPVVTASVASEGYAARDMVLNNKTSNNVSLGKQTEGMVSATNQIGAKDENADLLRRAIQNKPFPNALEKAKMDPVDSVAFINYADKNLKEEKRGSGIPYSGKVILSFTVNKKGVPENIKTEQSLCDACDKQAVSLLKAGPKWINSFGRRRQVVIEFKAAEGE